MVKYTLFLMIQNNGSRVYSVEFGDWVLYRTAFLYPTVIILKHGSITTGIYEEYKKSGLVPLFFDNGLKCWMIENPYNDEYYKTIDPERGRMFFTWLHQTERKEVFSSEN